MRVGFRVDASTEIGTGHVMRCLTLAKSLALKKVECFFLCKRYQGNLIKDISFHGFQVIEISGENLVLEKLNNTHFDWIIDAKNTIDVLKNLFFDWLIVDHYDLDEKWENAIRPYCGRIMVIDDLANRTHNCDLLLDQNLGSLQDDYANLVSPETKILAGPDFALLDSNFGLLRQASLADRSHRKLKQILISFGGVDKENVSRKVLELLNQNPSLVSCFDLVVILGKYSPHIESIKQIASNFCTSIEIKISVSNMAEVMQRSDLVIGACGISALERCILGLPSIVIAIAKNQQKSALALDKLGAISFIGGIDDLNSGLLQAIEKFKNQDYLVAMQKKASQVCLGNGVDRVVSSLFDDA